MPPGDKSEEKQDNTLKVDVIQCAYCSGKKPNLKRQKQVDKKNIKTPTRSCVFLPCTNDTRKNKVSTMSNKAENENESKHGEYKGTNFIVEKGNTRMDTQSVKTRLVKQANVIKGNRKIKIRIKDNRVHIKREQLQNQLDNAMRENRKLENHSSIKHKEKCQNESESEMHMLEENRYKYFSINYEMNNSEKPIKSSKQKPRFDVDEGVNVMENGIFYRGTSKTHRKTKRKKSWNDGRSVPSVLSDSVQVVENTHTNIHPSPRNIVQPMDDLPRSKYCREHPDFRLEEHSQKSKTFKSKNSTTKTKDPDIQTKQNKLTMKRVDLKPEVKKKTKHAKKVPPESRPGSRCFYSDEDDAVLVLQLVQMEIQKQYQWTKEVELRNKCNNGIRKEMKIRDSVFNLDAGLDNDTRGTTAKQEHEKTNSRENTDFTEEQQTLESDKNNDNNNTMPQSFVDIHDIGVNVPPPHHKTKNSKIPRVPSKVCLPYLTLIFTSFFSLLVVDLCIVYKYVDI